MAQSIKKAVSPIKINFRILHIIWKWENEQMTEIMKQVIQLEYHLKEWKRA